MGFKKNDYALTGLGFVARLESYINTETPECEVWGLYHEFGSVYSHELIPITEELALRKIEEFKKKGWAEE